MKTTTHKKTAKKVVARKRKKKLPTCTAKDLKTKRSKRRKCTVPAKKTPVSVVRPSPSGPVAAPPVTAPTPDAWTQPAGPEHRTDGIRTYDGTFGAAEATRLLFRAGYGPKPGQAEQLAAMGVKAAVASLVHPATTTLDGPAPSGDFLVGGQFAPEDRWGHGHLEWLDRCVRSTDQLGERMTLVLHDWVAISQAGVDSGAMRASIQKFRDGWRGSFRQLMHDMTVDPAMLQWLNGLDNRKGEPNENYARELMELFTLGADRGAYTENDVRELARALTGWTADWSAAEGLHNYRWDEKRRFDNKNKTVFKGTAYERTGNLNYVSAVDAVIDHPMHPSYVVLKLWGAFIPTAPTPQTQAELEALYRSGGESLAPLVEAILQHPDLYTGPSMTKSPVTYVAGLLRARGRGIDDDAWTWICSEAGQMLWFPPNVAGWNEKAWMNTTTYSARWYAAVNHVNDNDIDDDLYAGSTETPSQAVDAALAFWGSPTITAPHRAALDQASANAPKYWKEQVRKTMRQQALRMLVVAAPDFHVS